MLKLFFSLIILSVISINLQASPLIIGSKKFTESVLLGEILKGSLSAKKVAATHQAELGGTRILWNALLAGNIDVYPEYTGTIEEELIQKKVSDIEEMRKLLALQGIGITEPLGFNNTYALGMLDTKADKLNIESISDLILHPDLKLGWGEEFRRRQDGWPGLRLVYQLPQQNIRGLDHDIAYRALVNEDIDVMDLYSTDAEIDYYKIRILEDDKKYFPAYEAVYLYRLDSAKASPELLEVLSKLETQLTDEMMIALNRQAKIEKIPSNIIAADFIEKVFGKKIQVFSLNRFERVMKRTFEHLKLVLISLLAAIIVAIPLGVVCVKKSQLGQVILLIVSGIQTVPALALLVVLIRPLNLLGISGIGDPPAYIALFLYSLLPIVRNTFSGLDQIPLALKETSIVLGLSARTRLFKIELPLAMPSILAGIKTSAVLNIGFATLGALVGAGGYGQPILTGIRLDDYGLILEGALPAAFLALVSQFLFEFSERFLISRGLKN
jgi:osmoprotectant transport system permease protein